MKYIGYRFESAVGNYIIDSIWHSVSTSVMNSVRNSIYDSLWGSVTISQYQIRDGINEVY